MGKRVLILQWNSVNDNRGVTEAFRKMGFECSIADLNGQNCRENYHIEFFNDYLDKNDISIIYSTNYFDYLAEAAYTHGIPYIAWAYDSPTRIDNPEKLKYETTNVFMFDSCEVEKYRDRLKLKRVHYLPLAADIDRFKQTLSKPYNVQKYTADISFVGSLYDTEINKYLNSLSDYNKGYFNAIVDSCVGKYDTNVIETLSARNRLYIDDESSFNSKILSDEDNVKMLSTDDIAHNISARVGRMVFSSITNRERLILISMLSNHWKFKLYSGSTHEVFKTTEECGRVDYYREMPMVFKNSRINLNVTYKGIKTGIPLRCMDIMGCGGLLLTNYQRDFDGMFKDGENLLIYHSFEEAYDKCKYYLSHEGIRQKIAQNGYETVKKNCTYQVLLRQAIETAGLGYLVEGK